MCMRPHKYGSPTYTLAWEIVPDLRRDNVRVPIATLISRHMEWTSACMLVSAALRGATVFYCITIEPSQQPARGRGRISHLDIR